MLVRLYRRLHEGTARDHCRREARVLALCGHNRGGRMSVVSKQGAVLMVLLAGATIVRLPLLLVGRGDGGGGDGYLIGAQCKGGWIMKWIELVLFSLLN